jgi:hypothetical protein
MGFKAWDTTETFDYMPTQKSLSELEYVHRWANTPYFAGHGGVTPPVRARLATTPTRAHLAARSDGSTGTPDLQKNEDRLTVNLMVRI